MESDCCLCHKGLLCCGLKQDEMVGRTDICSVFGSVARFVNFNWTAVVAVIKLCNNHRVSVILINLHTVSASVWLWHDMCKDTQIWNTCKDTVLSNMIQQSDHVKERNKVTDRQTERVFFEIMAHKSTCLDEKHTHTHI